MPGCQGRQPCAKTWTRVATEEAIASGVDPCAVLAGIKRRPLVDVRRRAWRRLKDAPQGYSLAGIGRVSGFNHATIIEGLRLLGEKSCGDAALRKAGS
jgi:hypothetical protein